MEFPGELGYTKSHEWAKRDGDVVVASEIQFKTRGVRADQWDEIAKRFLSLGSELPASFRITSRDDSFHVCQCSINARNSRPPSSRT